MSDNLLQTKLHIPGVRSSLVSRPHLITQLNEGVSGKLTLVSAPPGFGKTTLVCTWLNQLAASHKAAWLSLDENDNDPVRFFDYFIGALQRVDPAAGQSLTNASPLPPTGVAMQLVLMGMSPALQPCLVVLDDYHVIGNRDIHEAIETLIAYAPPSMHLVIISRADPPFSLSKLRVRRQLCEIRARDLRFDLDEADTFLKRIMGLSLTSAEIELLGRRTEGWIGGLQLAAHSLQFESNKTTFLTAFAGNDRYIADYLMEEVLAAQPEAIQSFLLQSAILQRLSAPLCDAILERNDSQSILEFLEQSNLFIVPLDNRRQWYRYHHLFSDLLLDRLETVPDTAQRLHLRASLWYAENRQIPEAIEHALSAAAYGRAIELILSSALEIFMSSRLLTLLAWWQRLPEALRGQNLALVTMMAWAWLATGRLQESERGLQAIEHALGMSASMLLDDIDSLAPAVRNGLIEITAIRMSHQSADQIDAAQTLALCRRILPFLVPEEKEGLFTPVFVLRPVFLFNMGLSYRLLGQLEAAIEAFTEAVTQGNAFGNVHIVASSLGHLADAQIDRGQLRQAARTCEHGLETLNALAGKSSPISGLLHVQLGALFYEWNELATAVHHYREGITLAQPWRNKEALLPGYSGLARAYHALDRPMDAKAARKTYADLVDDEAATTSTAYEQTPAGLAALLRQAESSGRWGRVIALLIGQARLYAMMGDENRAVACLARAVNIAEPQNYVRSFIDEGESIKQLLHLGVKSGRLSTAYAQDLLSHFDAPHVPKFQVHADPSPVAALVEPLSERELEVLHLIAQGLTNREIALHLHLAVGTVKVHAHNIYGKLSARGRTQAVAKARSLRLLD